MNVDFLKGLREAFDLSQEGFARLIGVSVRTVARWEAGDVNPSQLAERQLTALDNLQRRLSLLMRPDSVSGWMARSHSRLGGRTPRQVLLTEGPEPLLNLLNEVTTAFEGSAGSSGDIQE